VSVLWIGCSLQVLDVLVMYMTAFAVGQEEVTWSCRN